VDRPHVHLKLPLPISTLGRRNRRTIRPGTLADGATVQALLADVLRREPDLARRILLVDESRWIESDDELLAVLVRRYPDEVAGDDLVPLAALPAPDPLSPGRTVLDRLTGGDPVGWFARYLDVLLDWHVALWLRYGVALEAHQQNIAVAMGPPGLRLIYKDNDGARLDLARLTAALGAPIGPDVLHDRRMAVAEPGELADVFVTITLHLCVGALIAACTTPGSAQRAELLELARVTLEDALARRCDPADAGSVAAADELRRVLDADRWPLKAMVTSGTLLPKQRLGCTDINKHYVRTGRNYLAPRASR
jgi:siderophore synthetase component